MSELNGRMAAQTRELEAIKSEVYKTARSITTLCETLESLTENNKELKQYAIAIKSHIEHLKGFCS